MAKHLLLLGDERLQLGDARRGQRFHSGGGGGGGGGGRSSGAFGVGQLRLEARERDRLLLANRLGLVDRFAQLHHLIQRVLPLHRELRVLLARVVERLRQLDELGARLGERGARQQRRVGVLGRQLARSVQIGFETRDLRPQLRRDVKHDLGRWRGVERGAQLRALGTQLVRTRHGRVAIRHRSVGASRRFVHGELLSLNSKLERGEQLRLARVIRRHSRHNGSQLVDSRRLTGGTACSGRRHSDDRSRLACRRCHVVRGGGGGRRRNYRRAKLDTCSDERRFGARQLLARRRQLVFCS
jgi:hypothetical protein